MVTILCMKWGTRYTANDVMLLYRQVCHNLSIPFRFVCLTEDAEGISAPVEVFPLPDIHIPPPHGRSPWKKLSVFEAPLYDITGTVLFLDLDLVITGSLDRFFEQAGSFVMIENWTQEGEGIGNSSVFRFEVNGHADILVNFRANAQNIVDTYDNEQIYVSRQIADHLSYWPPEWVISFKRHCVPRGTLRRMLEAPSLPSGAAIVAFHGEPKPEDAIRGHWKRARWWRLPKFLRPSPWIKGFQDG